MPTTQLRSCELRYFPDLCWADHLSLVRPRDAHLGWWVARKCLIPGASTGVSTGGRARRACGTALGSRWRGCRRPRLFGRRTTRQNDGHYDPNSSAERHVGIARQDQSPVTPNLTFAAGWENPETSIRPGAFAGLRGVQCAHSVFPGAFQHCSFHRFHRQATLRYALHRLLRPLQMFRW